MDPRASYAIYDTEKQEIQVNRVEYDVSAAAEAILNAGLPATNAHRLQLGR
jgi:diadenosine tetraphosphatase ApaH/serine/threonine PP2A family protein phosphatase